jgi:hypothetical protein
MRIRALDMGFIMGGGLLHAELDAAVAGLGHGDASTGAGADGDVQRWKGSRAAETLPMAVVAGLGHSDASAGASADGDVQRWEEGIAGDRDLVDVSISVACRRPTVSHPPLPPSCALAPACVCRRAPSPVPLSIHGAAPAWRYPARSRSRTPSPHRQERPPPIGRNS